MKLNKYAIYEPKRFRKWLIIIACFIVFLFIIFFSSRNAILHHIIGNKINNFNTRYPAKLIIESSCFNGITGIDLKGITIVPNDKDTLLNTASAHVGLKFFPMLFGKAKISDIEITGLKISLVRKRTDDNFSFLLLKKQKEKSTEVNYAAKLKTLSDALFGNLPRTLLIKDLSLNVFIDSSKTYFSSAEISMQDQVFKTIIHIKEKKIEENLIAEGKLKLSDRTFNFTCYSDNGKLTIPVLKNRMGLLIAFDTLNVGVSENKFTDDNYLFNGYTSIAGLLLNHKKISLTDVRTEKTSFDFNVRIGKEDIELDSTSAIVNNKFELNPYILFKRSNPKQLTFKIHKVFLAQDLFTSLPSGLFTNFEGIKTSGDLKLDMDLFVDMKQLDSMRFNITLTGNKFKILGYGETDLSKISGPFTYTAYENGKETASFLVSPDNPDFTSIDDISATLKDAVIIAENGGVYSQTGFDVNSLRLAIIENIKHDRFARGGSTIEMQLVKNVFLTRNKTIARKLEELLIVWLIENNNICSHERMFEVYLNIAEWGPGVYGIKQASRFYFNKSPAALTVPESIFLASLLPRPKWFKYAFDKNGKLNEDMNRTYFAGIAEVLIKRETILPSDTFKMLERVKLRAESRKLMMKDTSYFNIDSLRLYDDEFIEKDKNEHLKNN